MSKTLFSFYKAIEEMRKIDPEIQAQTVSCFLIVALNRRITMKEMVERTGLSQAAVSRNVAALSKVHRLNKPGYDLVFAFEDPEERRRKVVELTSKGKRVADSLVDILTNGQGQ